MSTCEGDCMSGREVYQHVHVKERVCRIERDMDVYTRRELYVG